jgi:hypothetical protein
MRKDAYAMQGDQFQTVTRERIDANMGSMERKVKNDDSK